MSLKLIPCHVHRFGPMHAVSPSCILRPHNKQTLVSHEKQLGKLQQANAQVEVDVEKVQRREAVLKEVALMKKKVPWLKYERMKPRVREMEVAVKARHKERDDLQTQVMAAREPLV
ncbi:unnamed protein product [Closterium sp. Yama58-4]|nr:unnamed protein product [Closterium sp. Yama58-4]